MSNDLRAIVQDTVELLDVEPPRLLQRDAPVLQSDDCSADSIYLVGLIGGKDVGKSSFVNALVGKTITSESSHGKGTEDVIAYAHESAAAHLKPMLESIVPGRFRIVAHRSESLVRQVLLDLPDIDSVYDDHIRITRHVLRHLLHPIWIQSVEKYADQNPQALLSRVAEGNDPGNFIFCLNKADQLPTENGAVEQLRQDFASRIGRLLNLQSQPRVFVVSARHPARFDLPPLIEHLSKQRPVDAVTRSISLASRRRDDTLLQWIDLHDLPGKCETAQRLLDDTRDAVAARIGAPLLERAVPRMMDDPGYRLSLVDSATARRLSRWPVVNVIQSVLSPITSLVRANAGASGAARDVEAHLDPGEPSTASRVQTCFAHLCQTSPPTARLLAANKLWEDLPAETAANRLSRRIASCIERQREAVVERFSHGTWLAPVRWLLTIGAILWFPIIQPILALLLERNWVWAGIDTLRLALEVLSAAYLLKTIGFLLLYFLVLWALLRWDTHRTVCRMIDQWKRPDATDEQCSPAAQLLNWLDELAAPVADHHTRLVSLVERIDQARPGG